MELACHLEAPMDTVLADANQLRQVFLNLIINAADAVSSAGETVNGKLVIQSALVTEDQTPSAEQQQILQIIFTDNGPGISEDDIGNIFDPFYTTKEPGKGTGLGLSVSFMIIQGFGGKLTVNSEKGEGTSMTILLPVIESDVDLVAKQGSLHIPSTLEKDSGEQPVEL
jgi:signal transduction histidine kinase